MPSRIAVLGGGLAGLSTAYELTRAGHEVVVLEREAHAGGMATSFEIGDRSTAGEPGSDYFSYDFGPHRFHSDEAELMKHVEEILGENTVWRQRLSRIHMMGRYFHYPLVLGNVLREMPPTQIARILFDYVRVRFQDVFGLRKFTDAHFKEWVERRFGDTLSRLFFVEYTEKTWGIPATEISTDWASQRITLLNLTDTIIKTVFPPRDVPRTLVSEFLYPKFGGIGELARGYVRAIEAGGGQVLLNAPALRVHRDGNHVTHVEFQHEGERQRLEADHYISTIPITALARSVVPKAPREVLHAINQLQHVSIVFVYLRLAKPSVSPDHWVYLPQKELRVHRISEFKNFSPWAAPPDETLICAEITCPLGGEIWRASPETLRDIAVADLTSLDLIEPNEVIDSWTKAIPFAYPLYDLTYREDLASVLEFVHGLENLKTGGRQGLFRYNNMDQSIEMGRRMGTADPDTSGDHEAVATEQKYFG